LLMAASALADPPVNDPQAALDLLDDFGGYFGRSGRLAGQALKIRIGALQALGRFDEADALIEQLLQTDPTGAGAVMASLLEAMLQGPGQAAKGLPEGRPAAERTVRLAERLVDWAAAHSAQVLPEDALGLRLQLAKAYQQAGKLDKALEVFNQCLRRDAELNRQRGRQPEPTNSAVLAGQAECLYQLGRYRQALEVFQRQLYERAEPYSAIWWRAYLRSLQCHAALHASPRTAEQRQQARQVLGRILQSITARRQIDPQMGGAELASQFDQLERKVAAQLSALSPQAERAAAGTGSQD
ncbi:MAG: tetratricopeptide repeat protein, partial [Phycisphaerae bacterium]